MKKLYYLIILTVILGLVLTGCFLSNVGQVPTTPQSGISYLTKHTEDDPFKKDLIADGGDPALAIVVGDVLVWNDGDYLYVKYVLHEESDWCLTETHLHVFLDNVGYTDVPQKNGNPPPGKFDYKGEHECVTEFLYTIPLTWSVDTPLFIAAHAVVERTETGTFTPELAWERSSEPTTFFFSGWGAAWTPAQAFTIPLDSNQEVWDNGIYYDNSVPPGREWASWEHVHEGFSDLRRFQAKFTVTEGYTVTGGSLYAAHFTGGIPINDNIYIFVNGEDNMLFWGGTRVWSGQISPNIFPGVTGRAADRGTTEPIETDRWYIPGTIPEVTGFIPDENVIDIFTEENARWGGMGKLVLELDYETTYTETAWAAGFDFPGKNWATYFRYCMQGDLWQIGTPHGDVNPIDGSAEYPANRGYTDEFLYIVGCDVDPIGAPTIPGLIGSINVCDIVSDGRPCTDTTEKLVIEFELYCNYAEGELTLIYDRYGSETDTLYFDNNITPFATLVCTGYEGKLKQFELSLPEANAGTHTITIAYEGGGSANGHYIDYLKLINY